MTIFAPDSFNLQNLWRSKACRVASTWPSYTSRRGNTLYCRMPRHQECMTRHNLAPGDVVSFCFPYLDSPDESTFVPLPVARPCLVAEVDAETESALIVFGTSRNTDANKGYDVRVSHDFAECGLDRPTRFVCSRRFRVSLRDRRFSLREQGTPVAGRLTGPLMMRMTRMLDLISCRYGRNDELRHIHEWIGANEVEDQDIVANLIRGSAWAAP